MPPREAEALASTKFDRPLAPPTWVPRERLLERLDRGAEGQLTLLAAPAGSGKSSLLAAWAAQRSLQEPVAWLSLDAGDSDPRRFWRAVVEALDRAGAGERIGALQIRPLHDLELIIPALVNAMSERPRPTVLVLDDLHEIGAASKALSDLDLLLRHPSANLRLVVATRVDPPLRLGRLRLAGQLAEIRERDLAFTLPETRALLEASGLALEHEQTVRLWQRTEGWAAGLRLAVLTLRGHSDPAGFVDGFAGDDATVGDYLVAEVLAQQPPELRDFLLRTSIVDLLSGELANALTGREDGEQMLTLLEHEHALIGAVGAERAWHRYHPLFAELLRSLLRYELPETVAELHRRAAAWFAARGRPAEALHHAAGAADWDHVAALAGRHWVPLLARGELDALRPALERLPAERIEADPELGLAVAGARLELGDERGAAPLARALTGRERVPQERRARFELSAATASLLLSRLRGDLAGARAAAAILLGGDRARLAELTGAEDLRALALANLGIVALWTGALGDAARDLAAARRAAERGHDSWLVLLCLAHLGALAVLEGRLERAARLADEVELIARRRGSTHAWPVGLAEGIRSAIALERNQLEEAERRFARCEGLLARSRDAPLRLALRLHRARLLQAAGRPEPALDAIEDVRELTADWPLAPALRGLTSSVGARSQLALGRPGEAEALITLDGDGRAATAEDGAALARLRLLDGEPEAACQTLSPWLTGAEAAYGSTRLELWLLDALAHDELADHSSAAASLERALDEAEPDGIRRPFVELGPPVTALLRRQLRHGTAHRSLAESLLRELDRPRGARRPGGPSIESLSDRETAVLRFLPTMMSNHEIASELYVSVNTVKTHLKAIYRKLDVPDRREAVRRARELELLGPA